MLHIADLPPVVNDREWACEQCRVVNERNFNASLNIRDEALRLITDVPVVASSGCATSRGNLSLVQSAHETQRRFLRSTNLPGIER